VAVPRRVDYKSSVDIKRVFPFAEPCFLAQIKHQRLSFTTLLGHSASNLLIIKCIQERAFTSVSLACNHDLLTADVIIIESVVITLDPLSKLFKLLTRIDRVDQP